MSIQKQMKHATAGLKMTNVIIEWLHIMYNKKTAVRVLDSLTKQLAERKKEFE